MDYKKPKKGYRLPHRATDLKERKSEPERLEQVSADLQTNVDAVNKVFEDSLDFIVRELELGPTGELKVVLVFLETLSDKELLSEFILKPLAELAFRREDIVKAPARLSANLPSAIALEEESEWEEVLKKIVTGHAVLFLDGFDKALVMEVRMWNERAVSEPQSESVVVGPREGFVESLITNVSLLRRRMRTPNLIMEAIPIGTTTNTNVVLCYVKGVVEDELVDSIKNHLKAINVEAMYGSNLVNEILSPAKHTPFQMFSTTERPDKVASAVMEGRVGILTENTPMALIIPTVFWQFFQASEDYYEHYPLATMNRLLRMFAFFLVVGFTAFYVAIVTFHHEMVPTQLLLSMAAVREPVPFPTALEALFLEITLEALREAGLRLPKPAGQAVSIVGALVMGQAAVEANLVSPQLVIVVALSGIASFIIPDYSFVIALRILKFGFILLASVFGVLGLMIGYMLLGVHLNSLQAFGVPYMSPVTPFKLRDMKDIFVRAPWWAMNKRGPEDSDEDGEGDNDEA
ncbi:MAG: spore germination protein [Firmicutes bacterium]|nr:spore germination protein [Bacillota bacterium]